MFKTALLPLDYMLSSVQSDVFHVIAESDLQSKELKPVVAGHKVNGVAVCIGVSP